MDWISRIAEEKIQEAMQEGFFDDLSLGGQPLRLDSNPFLPDHLRMTYKLLKQAGFLPPEMELSKEIMTLKDLLRAAVGDQDTLRLAQRINERVLGLNLMMKRYFRTEDAQVYLEKLEQNLR